MGQAGNLRTDYQSVQPAQPGGSLASSTPGSTQIPRHQDLGVSTRLVPFPHLFGPLPSAVQRAQDANRVPIDAVGGNVGSMLNDEFARTFDAAQAATFRRPRQPLDLPCLRFFVGVLQFYAVSFLCEPAKIL